MAEAPARAPRPMNEDELSVWTGTAVAPKRAREDRIAAVVLALALAAGFGVRFYLALADDGISRPRELARTLEPAHRLAFGYGLEAAPESWPVSAVVAALMKIGSSARGYVSLVRLFFAALSGLVAVACVSLVRKYGGRWLAAACGGAFIALMASCIYDAPRAMAPMAVGAPLVFGYALALRPDASRRRVLAGVGLASVAMVVDVQSAVLVVGLLAVLLARRRWRPALDGLLVVAVAAFLSGLLDLYARGQWFQSAVDAARADFGNPSQLGRSLAFYPMHLLGAAGPLAVALFAFALVGALRAPGLAAVTAAYLIAQLLAPGEDLRLLHPALPFVAVLGGLGVDSFLRIKLAIVGRAAVVVALAAAVGSAAMLPRLTFGDLGVSGFLPNAPALDEGGPENRLLLSAGEQRDVCGVKVATRELADTGGYAYLHRDVPLFGRSGPDVASGRFNYVVARRHDFEGDEVDVDGFFALLRLPGGCRAER